MPNLSVFTVGDLNAIYTACVHKEQFEDILAQLSEMPQDKLTLGTIRGEYRVGLHWDTRGLYFASVSPYEQRGMVSGMQDKRQLNLFEKL